MGLGPNSSQIFYVMSFSLVSLGLIHRVNIAHTLAPETGVANVQVPLCLYLFGTVCARGAILHIDHANRAVGIAWLLNFGQGKSSLRQLDILVYSAFIFYSREACVSFYRCLFLFFFRIISSKALFFLEIPQAKWILS